MLVVLLPTLVGGLALTPARLGVTSARVVWRHMSPRLSYDDAPDADAPDAADQTSLFASLRARSLELEEGVAQRWRSAECTSRICLAVDNWVRRMAVDWPRAVVGTAEGGLYLSDLSTGEILSRVEAHPGRGGSDRDMRLLYGEYDGGGLTAVAISGDVVVSAGRDAGARLWKIERDELIHVADLATDGAVVSQIAIGDGGRAIWLAGLDAKLRKFERAADGSAHPRACVCTHALEAAGAVLSLALDEPSGLVVAGTADGGIELFRADDCAACGTWRPLAFDGSSGKKGAATQSVAIAQVGTRRCVIAGGSDGTLYMRPMRAAVTDDLDAAGGATAAESGGDVFESGRLGQPLLPAHGGSLVALAPLQPSSSASLLISGAHDGTLRVWDLGELGADAINAKCLFGLGGYKVWLGSVWTDGKRLVSDGRDNLLVVHDFSEDKVDGDDGDEED